MKILLLRYSVRKRNFGPLDGLAAIEPPLWMTLRKQKLTEEGHEVVAFDNELADFTEEAILDKVLDTGAKKVEIWPTGNHPSAYIHQREGVDKLQKKLLEVCDDVVVKYVLGFDPTTVSLSWDDVMLSEYRAHNWHCWGGIVRQPYGVLFTSIGCPYQCQFCSVKDFYGVNYKLRPVELIRQDLRSLMNQGVRNVKMMDELFFTSNNQRFAQVCKVIEQEAPLLNIWAYARVDTITEERLEQAKRAGLRWIGLGIESGDDKVRESMMKGNFTNDMVRKCVQVIKSFGISVGGNFMFGFPDDTLETMQRTFDLAMELRCEFANLYSVMAYPGSPLYQYALDKKWELPKSWVGYSQYSPECFPLRTNTLTNAEVLKFRDEAFTKYYTDEGYLSFMKSKFGQETVEEIKAMTDIKLKRNLYADNQ